MPELTSSDEFATAWCQDCPLRPFTSTPGDSGRLGFCAVFLRMRGHFAGSPCGIGLDPTLGGGRSRREWTTRFGPRSGAWSGFGPRQARGVPATAPGSQAECPRTRHSESGTGQIVLGRRRLQPRGVACERGGGSPRPRSGPSDQSGKTRQSWARTCTSSGVPVARTSSGFCSKALITVPGPSSR